MHKAGLHFSKSPTGPYLENVFRVKLVYKDDIDFGIMHKESSPNYFKAQERKINKNREHDSVAH